MSNSRVSNELRHYRSQRHARVVAKRLNACHDPEDRTFTVEQHPYDFGWGIRTTDFLGRVAWVTKGSLRAIGFNSRGVATNPLNGETDPDGDAMGRMMGGNQ